MRPFSRRPTGTSKAHAERRIAVTIFCLRERLRLQFQKKQLRSRTISLCIAVRSRQISDEVEPLVAEKLTLFFRESVFHLQPPSDEFNRG
jgi:hypothetical protein